MLIKKSLVTHYNRERKFYGQNGVILLMVNVGSQTEATLIYDSNFSLNLFGAHIICIFCSFRQRVAKTYFFQEKEEFLTRDRCLQCISDVVQVL